MVPATRLEHGHCTCCQQRVQHCSLQRILYATQSLHVMISRGIHFQSVGYLRGKNYQQWLSIYGGAGGLGHMICSQTGATEMLSHQKNVEMAQIKLINNSQLRAVHLPF